MKYKKNISVLLCVAILLTSVRLNFALGEDNKVSNTVTVENIEETFVEETTTLDLEETTTETVIEVKEVETTTASIDKSILETTDEVLEETEAEISTEIELTSETEITTEDINGTTAEATSEAITTTNIENNTTLIIEAETPSEATYVKFDKELIATISKAEKLIGETENSDLKTPIIRKSSQKRLNKALPAGFTVDIVDRSYAKNEDTSLLGANPSLPETYDSRYIENTHGVDIIPPVRNQTEFGTCWAFATIGAIETSLRAKSIISSDTEEGADLSEAALALYTIEGLKYITNNNSYIDYPGVENADYSGLNYDYYTNVRHIPVASVSFAMCGENITSALLTSSTYMGIVSENDFPHTAENIRAIERELHSSAGLADGRKPYAFNSNRYEVLNADFINKYDKEIIKEAIMKYGSVGIGYYEYRDDTNCHQASNGEWYYLSPDKACKIEDDGSCGEEYKLGVNHAVMVVGWDDNASYDNFYFDESYEIYEDKGSYIVASCSITDYSDTETYYPTYSKVESRVGLNGAWLIRNSWGDDNEHANGGYFWLPYSDFNTDDIFYAVDADVANKYKYNYHYDTTNNLSTYNYHGLGKLANIFKVSSDIDQVLDAVNIAWQSANIDYEIDIYTNDTQMSNPEDGTHILNQSVHSETAGIKTVPLNKNVLLLKDTYFSIIVKANNYESIIFADYAFKSDDEDRYYYNEVKLGESFENDDGTWRDLNEIPIYEIAGKKYGCFPRIRGLTDEARVIRFDSGGGTGNMLPQGIKFGETEKINQNTFTKDGFTFYKWIDQNGNEYDDEAYIVLSDDVILTAEWQARVTYDVNGHGSITPDYVDVVYNGTTVLPILTNVTGYTFDLNYSWYDGQDFSTANCVGSGGEDYTVTGPIRLYARWNENEYNITLHNNGGTYAAGYIAPATRSYTEAKTLPTSANITKENYTFDGWYDNSEYTGTKITNIPALTGGDKEYWLKWNPITYNLTYILNKGEWESTYTAPTSWTVESASTTALPTSANITRNHYDFGGWFEQSDFSGAEVTSLVGKTYNLTLYAKWTFNPGGGTYHDITFTSNGGSGTMEVQHAFEGEDTILHSNEFTKTGYTFYRWISSDGRTFSNGQNIGEVTTDLTLSADWMKNPTPAPSPTPSGESSSSSGGGGTSGGPTIPNSQVLDTIEVSTVKSEFPALESTKVSWIFDPKTNKFKLNVDIDGQKVLATNGFYTLNEVETVILNNNPIQISTQNIYYFDLEGNMITGFVKTSDGKTYFFENAKTKDEGKMILGWKLIQGDWYYFSNDGSMLKNSMTPDGYLVGSDGKYVQ